MFCELLFITLSLIMNNLKCFKITYLWKFSTYLDLKKKMFLICFVLFTRVFSSLVVSALLLSHFTLPHTDVSAPHTMTLRPYPLNFPLLKYSNPIICKVFERSAKIASWTQFLLFGLKLYYAFTLYTNAHLLENPWIVMWFSQNFVK